MAAQLSIGEFSKITGLTVKALRLYDEQGLLVPKCRDAATAYRYYDQSQAERAAILRQLKALDFSLEQIRDMLDDAADETNLAAFFERQRAKLAERIGRDRSILRQLDGLIREQRQADEIERTATERIERKSSPPLLAATIRMRGKYCDCGQGFSRLGRAVGRYIAGKPFCLYHDDDYREEDADFEVGFPIGRAISADGIAVRELPAAEYLSLLHRGPYHQLGRTYYRLFQAARQQKLRVATPCREIFIKGPGLIFRGNPANYLTEVGLLVEAGQR